MKSSSDYDTSWIPDYVAKTLSHAVSVSEATEHLQAVIALLNAGKEEWQSRQEEKRRDKSRDEERQGYIMKEIYDIASRLGINPNNDLPRMKGMTTVELEDLREDLKKRLDNRSRKKLSAA